MKMKEFDCVQMQHRGAEGIREKLAGKTREEQLERRFSRKEMRLKRALDFVGKCGLVSVIVSHE
jgi:hypothetical protein